ncbi:MAG TPA: insulinase family protein [Kofleriaceae bacterium]|nr:insulinase family protein [Kofleriaceae bacterium]
MKALVFGVFLATACAPLVMPPPAPPRQTNLALKITSGRVANGLRVVLVHDPRAAEVQVTMRYAVGAADDPPGQDGIAHLAEHLMFHQVLGSQTLVARLEDIATSFNAFTSWDATTYVSRAAPSRLDELLSVEAVRVGFRCTSITDAVFARERDVVMNELRLSSDTAETRRAVRAALYPDGHPYQRELAGSYATVAALTREQVCAFVDAHYATSNAVLVVSGDVTPARLDAALAKFMTRIPSRPVRASASVPALATNARQIAVRVPLEDEALLVTWPLPVDQDLRAKVVMAARVVGDAIDGNLPGEVTGPYVFGGDRAPIVGLLVEAGDVQVTRDKLVEHVRRATRDVDRVHGKRRGWFGKVLYSELQQHAIYSAFADLEEGSARDTNIAADVLAGRDLDAALGAHASALGTLTAADLAAIAKQHLRGDRAAIVVLEPNGASEPTQKVSFDTPVHDVRTTRDLADPREAHAPDPNPMPERTLVGTEQRTLPNGMRVVLLPVTSVPTVEMRLVFASGSADEPPAIRGAAIAAGQLLNWNKRHLHDYLRFVASGGSREVTVETDHTTFSARGLDMHLDLLLGGLRRWVREGVYDSDDIAELRKRAEPTRDTAIEDSWRAALYGTHPYAMAGQLHHVSPRLTLEDVKRFRAAHFTPRNATLVIAGRFDAALANRWIDFLFADWRGELPTRSSERAAMRPTSVAIDNTTPHVFIRIAFPAPASGAPATIVGEMLDLIARDVRHRLGASYTFGASYQEQRRASYYVIEGSVDAAHATEAIELVRARITALHDDPDEAARTFVTARRRSLTHLLQVTTTARALASAVERSVELARQPLSDAALARAVHDATIESAATEIRGLDVGRAAIVMRGPTEQVDRAFAVLGRKPQRPVILDREDPTRTTQTVEVGHDEDDFTLRNLEDPITEPPAPREVSLAFAGGYTTGRAEDHGVSGYKLNAQIGYRFERTMEVGLRLSLADVSGTYLASMLDATPVDIALTPVHATVVLQTTAYDRVWGAVGAGLAMTRERHLGADDWKTAAALTLAGGIDFAVLRRHHLGLHCSIDSEFGAGTGYRAFTIGIGYRR